MPTINNSCLFMRDQIFVPTSTGLRPYPLLSILGIDYSMLESTSGFGMQPLHFITQRGPFQDGETPLDMRYDTRTIQIGINESLYDMIVLEDRRWELVDLLRPSRSFKLGEGVTTLVYRRFLTGGSVERGTDLATIGGSGIVTSLTGKFVHNGLVAGMGFELTSGADAGNYQITEVTNDYTLTINPAPANTLTNVHWRYNRGQSIRDLNCLLERGPSFDNVPARSFLPWPAGYVEALRFVAHNPFWFGVQQQETWTVPEDIGDLIFDYPIEALLDSGAWFGESRGVGRWLFTESYVGDVKSIIYWGHEATQPTIEIDGPADTPVIQNVTTSVTLTLDYSIALGETVVIDTQNKSVVNNSGTNLFQYITGDLATFAIEAEPQAPNRINEVSISYGSGTSDSAARILWRNKYSTI